MRRAQIKLSNRGPRDMAQVIRIECEAFKKNADLYPEAFICQGGRIFILGHPARATLWVAGHGRRLYVASVGVGRRWLGRRVGYGLVRYAQSLALVEGYREVYLHVRRSNERAMRLYEGCGFLRAKLLVNHYGDEDAWECVWIVK